MKKQIFLLILAFIFLGACSPSTESNNPTELNNPAWVNELITRFQNEPVGNPPQSIYSYEYKGQTVYYIPPQCCDIPSTLVDAEGNLICLPSGGITGSGDGRCPYFLSARSNEVLVWQDSRTR